MNFFPKKQIVLFVVLKIAAAEMNNDGYKFGVTENEVWCTEEVPVKYICDRIYKK